MIGGASIFLAARADEGTVLHSRHVGRIRSHQNAVRTLLRINRDGRARKRHQLQHSLVFRLRTITPMHPFRLAHPCNFLNPTHELSIDS